MRDQIESLLHICEAVISSSNDTCVSQILVSKFVNCKKKKKNLHNNERRYLCYLPTNDAVWIAQMFSKRFLREETVWVQHTDCGRWRRYWAKAPTSMCWNMYGWLQIFFSCIIVFIKVFAPPLPWWKQPRQFENTQKIWIYVYSIIHAQMRVWLSYRTNGQQNNVFTFSIFAAIWFISSVELFVYNTVFNSYCYGQSIELLFMWIKAKNLTKYTVYTYTALSSKVKIQGSGKSDDSVRMFPDLNNSGILTQRSHKAQTQQSSGGLVPPTFLSFSEPSVRRMPFCMWRYRTFWMADMSHFITYST